ncbi:MAG TPA: acyl-CoA dehydrogenase family protein [Candidatus Polarisedimenticolia bacterium]|nr:acyl-CoA dehydrogenase family protein [Candidatus Polarisedimenticolia bacterium]
MTSVTSANLGETLDRLSHDTIAPAAAEVDRTGAFPDRALDALRGAGLLGATSSKEVGGLGFGLREASTIVRRVARDCGSTAMVLCMHYSGTSVLEALGDQETRRAVASGRHLSTLAFSEAGSRSHFWAPLGTATRNGSGVVLNARKSWVTSASKATAYVWSSKPLAAEGFSTLWLVPATASGLSVRGPFDGLGLRGNDSSPVGAENVKVPESAMLGEDGRGFDVMMGTVLPVFQVLNASFSVGAMESAVERTAAHASGQRYGHIDASLADLPTIRANVARMRIKTDAAAALLDDTLAAATSGRADAMLRVLESKAMAGETANEVLDLAMRTCGGQAFRKEVGVERLFRDARAAGVMAPTTDLLYDFIGKAVCGLPLF